MRMDRIVKIGNTAEANTYYIVSIFALDMCNLQVYTSQLSHVYVLMNFKWQCVNHHYITKNFK